MKEEVNIEGCGRENDLIAYLYGELDRSASSDFQNHMQECRSCVSELAEFTNIRESVGAWRDEALGGMTSPAFEPAVVVRSGAAKPSALNALREFFNLSPLWMKGAVGFASVLFCLFAVLAIGRLRETPAPPIATSPQAQPRSEQEFRAAVERRVQDELQGIKNSTTSTPNANTVADGTSNRVFRKRVIKAQIAAVGPQQPARRPLSKVERQQLAADLRLIENPTDGDLDWLDDRINQ
ncbi:MAG TPA: hypothetical protein VMS31_01145 [Pyrinomonadaceae bacterium]|nr:hypothetical protein [Pyrinomonadaceae bacterium]